MKSGKSTMQTALVFECLGGLKSDNFMNRQLYTLPEVPGVWRRVGRTSSSLAKRRKGAELAFCDGQIIELVRDKDAEAELAAAGFFIGTTEQRAAFLEKHGLTLPSQVVEPEGPTLFDGLNPAAGAVSSPGVAAADTLLAPAGEDASDGAAEAPAAGEKPDLKIGNFDDEIPAVETGSGDLDADAQARAPAPAPTQARGGAPARTPHGEAAPAPVGVYPAAEEEPSEDPPPPDDDEPYPAPKPPPTHHRGRKAR